MVEGQRKGHKLDVGVAWDAMDRFRDLYQLQDTINKKKTFFLRLTFGGRSPVPRGTILGERGEGGVNKVTQYHF